MSNAYMQALASRPQSSMDSAMSGLGAAFARLDSMVLELERRMVPILSSPVCASTNDSTGEESDSAKLVVEINTQTQHAQQIADKISAIMNRMCI